MISATTTSVQRVPTPTVLSESPPRPSSVSEPRSQINERTYNDVFALISERYSHFQPDNEIGFQQRPGVTADIEPISKRDLISVLEHIKSSDSLADSCRRKSAKAPFFNKFYLMSNPDQGWNLRLHSFNVRGSGLGGEDSPHYHRWTLGSKVIAGGYMNVNYHESPITERTMEENTYSKFELGASDDQAGQQARQVKYLGQAEVRPTEKNLYARDDLNHFPISKPHSVETHPSTMGTTLTLAHTSRAASNTSIAFEKAVAAEGIPQIKIDSNEVFASMLQDQITHLGVLVASDDLYALLQSKHQQGVPLTVGEEKHLADYSEPNYVETSLLPALAIFQMESLNGVEHGEFSIDTAAFIESQLSEMDQASLRKLIFSNQSDLYDKQLSVEIDDVELARQLADRNTKVGTTGAIARS